MTRPQKPKTWLQKIKQRSAHHYALFKGDLPFGHKVEVDKTKYTRKQKHKGKAIDE
jgi:hypothetical protein